MWVIFHRATRRIVGMTANTALDQDKDAALSEIVRGLMRKQPIDEYDAIQVENREKATDYMASFPQKLQVIERDGRLKLTIREPETFSLWVTHDAPEQHPFDKIAMIPGDGTSSVMFEVQKIDERTIAQRRDEDNQLLHLRADHGTLLDESGANEIRSVELRNGHARFRLRSEPGKRVATVEILPAEHAWPGASLRVAFS